MKDKLNDATRIALNVVWRAILIECLFFAFLGFAEALMFIFIIAFLTCIPAFLVYSFLLFFLHLTIRQNRLKWIAIVIVTLLCANATLYLAFGVLLNESSDLPDPFEFSFFNAIVTIATIASLLLTVKSIENSFFKPKENEEEE